MAINSVSKLIRKRNAYGDIDLNNFDKLKEGNNVYGSNALCWFKFDDGRVLFKRYDNEIEPFGEVLYSKIANKYSINCAQYDFASYKQYQGTISYDIAYGEHKMAIDGVTLFVRYNPNQLPDIIKKNLNLEVMLMFNKKYNNYEEFTKLFKERYPSDVDTLQEELVKMFVLDVLLDHCDKNLWNIMIVTDEYGNNPHLYSIDSSHIARLNEGKEYIKNAINEVLTSDGSITIEDYLGAGIYGYDVGAKDLEYNPVKNLIDFYYNLDNIQRDKLVKFVKDIEINDIIEELSKIKKIDPMVITWINAVFNSRKGFLLKKFYHINDNYKGEHSKRNFHLRVKR